MLHFSTHKSDLFYSKTHIFSLTQATCNFPRGKSQTQIVFSFQEFRNRCVHSNHNDGDVTV